MSGINQFNVNEDPSEFADDMEALEGCKGF